MSEVYSFCQFVYAKRLALGQPFGNAGNKSIAAIVPTQSNFSYVHNQHSFGEFNEYYTSSNTQIFSENERIKNCKPLYQATNNEK